METLTKELAAAGFKVSPAGEVSVPYGVKINPREAEMARYSTWAAAWQADRLDLTCASMLESVNTDFIKRARSVAALDHMNAIRLNSLGYVDWDYVWQWDDQLPSLFPGLGKVGLHLVRSPVIWALAEEGEMPAWLNDYIMRGTRPSAVEAIAFGLYPVLHQDASRTLMSKFLGEHIPPEKMDDFFHDGKPYQPLLRPEREDTYSEVTEPPRDIVELIYEMQQTYDESEGQDIGAIKVSIAVVNSEVYVTALLPGTMFDIADVDGWTKHQKGADWVANVHSKAYGTSAVNESNKAAIDLAVQQFKAEHPQLQFERPHLLIGGHSQGGLNGCNIGIDPSFAASYRIDHIVTVGSPVSDIEVPATVQVINLVNQYDVVPKLSGDLSQFGNIGPFRMTPDWSAESYNEVFFAERNFPETPGLSARQDPIGYHHSTRTYSWRVSSALADGSIPQLTDFNAQLYPFIGDAGQLRKTYTVQVGRG